MSTSHPGNGRSNRAQRSRRYLVIVFGGLALALAATIPASAATTIYVDSGPGCSDAGPGTSGSPLCTISEGARRAVAGDTVTVATGTYAEAVDVLNSGTSTAPIVFTAAPGASVTVSGQTNGFRVAGEQWVTIRGFKVLDTVSHGITVSNSSNIRILSNDVSGAGTQVAGATGRGISIATTTSSVVSSNVTHNNSDAGIFVGIGATGNSVNRNRSYSNAQGFAQAAAGIDVRGASSTVLSNVSYANEDSGINVWDGANGSRAANNLSVNNGDHGIDVKQSNNVKILSNTIYGNVATGVEVFTSTGTSLANNILVDNGQNNVGDSGNLLVDASSTATTSLNYDLFHLSNSSDPVMIDWAGVQYSTLAAFKSATGREPNGIQADPRFRSPATGDFQLLSGSPAIDSANSGVLGQPPTDLKDQVRVDDPSTPNTGAGPRLFDDRGAFEFVRAPK